MLKLPVSGISNVESMRTSVDFPEPLAPRIPTISRRLIVRLTLSIARTSCFRLFSLRALLGQRSNGRDFLNTFETPSTTMASFEESITTFSKRGVCIVMLSIAMYSLSPAEKTQQKTVGLDCLLPEPTVEGVLHLSN